MATKKTQRNVLKKAWSRRWVKLLAIAGCLLLLLFLFRTPILKGAGNYLISETNLSHADAIVVLGGNSLERGQHASELFHKGLADEVWCSGGNVPTVLTALDTVLFEAQISKNILVLNNVPEDACIALTESTSTYEEAQEILDFASSKSVDTLIVVSSKFHTRRVGNVFDSAFEDSGITVLISGAPSLTYDEDSWFSSEQGMIMVNNEYMKLLYYALNH